MATIKITWSPEKVADLFAKLKKAVHRFPPPMSLRIAAEHNKDPYLILISCLLSLRARDTMTYPVSKCLFERASTPQAMLALPRHELEELIHSIGTYRKKAATLQQVSAALIADFQGKVPSSEADLLSLPGVGRKTANLVRSVAFDIPAICVDVHVHRIANRLGMVASKTPEETEMQLKRLLPVELWSDCNYYFVIWGQYGCRPGKSGVCKPGCPFFNMCSVVNGRQP